MNTGASFEIVPVWKNITSELSAELIGMWGRAEAIADPGKAALRAGQAVPEADATFIGYSPRGLQLYASYFPNAKLFAPSPLARRRPIAS